MSFKIKHKTTMTNSGFAYKPENKSISSKWIHTTTLTVCITSSSLGLGMIFIFYCCSWSNRKINHVSFFLSGVQWNFSEVPTSRHFGFSPPCEWPLEPSLPSLPMSSCALFSKIPRNSRVFGNLRQWNVLILSKFPGIAGSQNGQKQDSLSKWLKNYFRPYIKTQGLRARLHVASFPLHGPASTWSFTVSL